MTVLLASAIFLVRGPLRARTDYINDFATPYVSTRLWFNHQNPYDSNLFLTTWHAAGAPQGFVGGNPSGRHSVYPPSTFVILVPLAALPWSAAVDVLTLTSVASYVIALFLFTTLLPGTWHSPTRPFFFAFGLALAPAQSSLHVTNIACLSASLLCIAVYRLLKRTPSFDLIFVACATLSACLKPTIGLLILPYLLLIRGWRLLAATLAACTIFAGVSLVPFYGHNSEWLTSLRENLSVVFMNGGAADLSESNLNRFDRIDLQPPLYAITHGRTAASLLAALVAAILLIAWFRIFRKPLSDIKPDERILCIAGLLMIGLIPFYQRYYSAILLLPAILWAFRNLSRPVARWILGLSAVFLINTEALLRSLLSHQSSGFANIVIGPHLCWLLLALACLLLAACRLPSAREA